MFAAISRLDAEPRRMARRRRLARAAKRTLAQRCEQPIETLARAQLTQRWKKIRKRGRMLAKLDAQARHKLRIQAKKLRYAAQFYETVFPGKKREKRRESFLSALKDMQDCFGDLNDVTVHESLRPGSPRRRLNGRQGRPDAYSPPLADRA